MTTQQDVFNSMALQLLTDPMELVRYANEDQLGGYHWDGRLAKWPMGSLFSEEGQVLYALIRKYKPQRIVEIGTLRGCSTAHMATALDVNDSDKIISLRETGHIWAIDVNASAGDLFPAHLKSYVTSVTGDGLAWLAGQEDESIDFLFEDSSHGEDMCASIAALCKTKLKPGGILVMHDAAHDFSIDGNGSKTPSPYGGYIRAGLTRALGNEYRTYLAEPSDCGFALWRKPGVTHTITLQDAIQENPNEAVWGLLDKHSTPVDMWKSTDGQNWVNDARPGQSVDSDPHANLTGQIIVDEFGNELARARSLEPIEPQMIDNEFKSQEHLPPEELPAVTESHPTFKPLPEFDTTEERESKPVEPPKKKRGRPSKKDKAG